MLKKSLCGLCAAVSLFSAVNAQAEEFSYNIYVPGITNIYANPSWHQYGWWSGEGGNPIEIPVVSGETISLNASGIIDYSAVRDPGDSAYGPDGWTHGDAPNGVPFYGMAGIWVSAIDRSQSPYWGLTPIGSVFQVGSDFSAVAPAGAVALMLGVTDPNYVVDQDDIDDPNVSYYDQSDLGQLDGDGQYFVEVVSTAAKSEFNAPQNLPNAVLTADKMTGAAPLTIQFDASESTDDGDIVRYKWNFGDGDETRDTPQTHTYQSPGTYTVTMTAVDNLSLSNSVSLTINVIEPGQNLPPEAVFEVSADTYTITVDASDSIDRDGVIAEYVWDFGDGTEGTGVEANHTYAEVGYYTIKLSVSDNVGDSSASTHTLSLIGVAAVSPSEPTTDPDPEPTPEPEVDPDTGDTETDIQPEAETNTPTSSGGGGAMGAALVALGWLRRRSFKAKR